jgi:hypothetical protein
MPTDSQLHDPQTPKKRSIDRRSILNITQQLARIYARKISGQEKKMGKVDGVPDDRGRRRDGGMEPFVYGNYLNAQQSYYR